MWDRKMTQTLKSLEKEAIKKLVNNTTWHNKGKSISKNMVRWIGETAIHNYIKLKGEAGK